MRRNWQVSTVDTVTVTQTGVACGPGAKVAVARDQAGAI